MRTSHSILAPHALDFSSTMQAVAMTPNKLPDIGGSKPRSPQLNPRGDRSPPRPSAPGPTGSPPVEDHVSAHMNISLPGI